MDFDGRWVSLDMQWRRIIWQGLTAGTVGVTVMTLSEKLEQRVTGRPDSYVPARTMERATGMPEAERPRDNLLMHAGQAIALGVLRSTMAHAGLRGPWSSAKFTVIRLTNDQVLENATGVGAPPQTWPRQELVVDLVHKSVYGLVTGLVADALAARDGLGPGQLHAAKAPGRQRDVGPVPRR